MAAGASGAWIGTAFAACRESTLPDAAREVMIAADGTDTVVTRAFDIALGYPWPAWIPERVIGNEFTDARDGREHELAADHGALRTCAPPSLTATTAWRRSTPDWASATSSLSNPRPPSSHDFARKPGTP